MASAAEVSVVVLLAATAAVVAEIAVAASVASAVSSRVQPWDLQPWDPVAKMNLQVDLRVACRALLTLAQ